MGTVTRRLHDARTKGITSEDARKHMHWPEICEHLAFGNQVITRTEQVVVVCHGNDDQRVRVELVRAFDEPWLLFLTPVVREREARLHDALMLNMRMALAALAIDQGYLVLRAMCRAQDVEPRDLDRTVAFLITEARRLQAVSGTLRGSSPYDIFDD